MCNQMRLKPFVDEFPAENIRHHFIGQDAARGVYAKELRIPSGFTLISHRHTYDHLSILASGNVWLSVDGVGKELRGPSAITIKASVEHTLLALTDAVWFCVHPSDETESDAVDITLVERV